MRNSKLPNEAAYSAESFNQALTATLPPVASALQTILSRYFDSHSADETQDSLSDLLSVWTSSDTIGKKSYMDIANMVFFVSNITAMIRKVSTIKCLAGHYTDLIDDLDSDYVEDLLNEILQCWIYPDDYSGRSINRIMDAQNAFQLLGKLVTKLESISKVEEGVSC